MLLAQAEAVRGDGHAQQVAQQEVGRLVLHHPLAIVGEDLPSGASGTEEQSRGKTAGPQPCRHRHLILVGPAMPASHVEHHCHPCAPRLRCGSIGGLTWLKLSIAACRMPGLTLPMASTARLMPPAR